MLNHIICYSLIFIIASTSTQSKKPLPIRKPVVKLVEQG